MKHTNFLTVVLMLCAVSSIAEGCQESDLDIMAGSYTYKTSGIVGLLPTQLIGTGLPVDTTWVALTPEQGQINIARKDADKSLMLVTWNDITGNACSTDAVLEGDELTLTLTPNTKTATLTDGKDTLGGGVVKYSGTATLYDNMLIFSLQYQGSFTISSTPMTIVGSKIECIAKAN